MEKDITRRSPGLKISKQETPYVQKLIENASLGSTMALLEMTPYFYEQLNKTLEYREKTGRVIFPEVADLSRSTGVSHLQSFAQHRVESPNFAKSPPFDGLIRLVDTTIDTANRGVVKGICNKAARGDEASLTRITDLVHTYARYISRDNALEAEEFISRLNMQYIKDYLQKIIQSDESDVPYALYSMVNATKFRYLVDERRKVLNRNRAEENRLRQAEQRIPAEPMHEITDIFTDFPDSRTVTDKDEYRTLLNNFVQKYNISDKPISRMRAEYFMLGQQNVPTAKMTAFLDRVDIKTVKSEVSRIRNEIMNPFLIKNEYYLPREFPDLLNQDSNPDNITPEELYKAAHSGLCESFFFMGYPYITREWFQKFRSNRDKQVIREDALDRPKRNLAQRRTRASE